MLIKKHRAAVNKIILFILFVIVALLCNKTNTGFRTEIIGGDGRGYYAYLPSTFIYHTLDFTQVAKAEQSGGSHLTNKHYYIRYGDNLIDKYTAGTPLMLLPFFLLSYLIAIIFGLDASGYSPLFHYGALLASLLYAFLGLLFLYRLLKRSGFGPIVSGISSGLILLGTNLFFYTFLHPGVSHVYSFATMSAFLYFIHGFLTRDDKYDLLFASLAFGIGVLIRPFNVLAISLVFFISPDLSTLKSKMIEVFYSFGKILKTFIPFIFIISIQIIINLIQTGKVFVWSYRQEGFYFDHPQILNVLFSYRKGLFIYTPLLLIAILGLVPLYRKSKYKALTGLAFFLLITYFISSWWNWFYGDSFGMRPYIDYYPFFAILLAHMISSFQKLYVKIFAGLLFGFFIFLNLFQTYQYQHGIIHHDSMNKEKYWFVFLKSGTEYENILGGGPESIYKESELIPFKSYQNDFLHNKPGWWVKQYLVIKNDGKPADTVCHFLPGEEFGCTLDLSKDSLFKKGGKYFIRANADFMELDTNACSDAYLVASISTQVEGHVFYKAFRIKQVPGNEMDVWKNYSFAFLMENPSQEKPTVKIYLWNKGKKEMLIRDMNIQLFRPPDPGIP